MVMGMMVAFIGDGGGAWRYGDDVGDDLDGIVAVWWLRQQGAAKVATGGRNLAGWRRRRRKIRRGGRLVAAADSTTGSTGHTRAEHNHVGYKHPAMEHYKLLPCAQRHP
ncbi:hypothetical protein Tco_1463306, partial [Tanacetum coccineum]